MNISDYKMKFTGNRVMKLSRYLNFKFISGGNS